MKIAGKVVTNEQAYDLLSSDESLIASFEVTQEERDGFVGYATIRSHHDYIKQISHVRRDRSGAAS